MILSHAKLALQASIEASPIPTDSVLSPILHRAFPRPMQERFVEAINTHQLRSEIIATKVANAVVNRLGLVVPFELAEEEGVGLARVAGAYLACDTIFGLTELFGDIETAAMSETGRLDLLEIAARALRLHIADLIRVSSPSALPGEMAEAVTPGVARLDRQTDDVIKSKVKDTAAMMTERLALTGASQDLIRRVRRLIELDGAIAMAALASRTGWNEVEIVAEYGRLGEELGLAWAKTAAQRLSLADPWERLLTAGLARDFQQLRLDFLAQAGVAGPAVMVERWLGQHQLRVERFTRLVHKARTAVAITPAMLAQIANQARILFGRRADGDSAG